ncbi:MAG: sensor histidine kinase [Syntrophobacteraceae bacterium]
MDRLSSLGQLSAGIAHEIRNPLASINFNVQMLAKKLPLDDHLKLIIQDTLEGIDRIKTLVKGILDFTRPKVPALEPGSIESILIGSISLMRSQFASKDIEVKMDLHRAVPQIIFDPHQIQQVLIQSFPPRNRSNARRRGAGG